MRLLLFLISISFTTPILGQYRLDSLDCVKINIDEFRQDFINKPTCKDYSTFHRYYMCRHQLFNDLQLTYIAAQVAHCPQAYHDLYAFYKDLNYNLSEKKTCNEDSLLLDNLDNNSRNIAINALLKSENDNTDLAVYYYYGVYVKKDIKKAISLIRESYTYKVSDKKIIEELDDMKSSLVPCRKQYSW